MNHNFHKKTFILTSSINNISFVDAIDTCTKIRIESVSYITQTAGQRYMQIEIDNFQTNSEYIQSNSFNNYSFVFLLENSAGLLNRYVNKNPVSFDCVRSHPTKMKNFKITLKIDNAYSSDISSNNPVILEVHFE